MLVKGSMDGECCGSKETMLTDLVWYVQWANLKKKMLADQSTNHTDCTNSTNH